MATQKGKPDPDGTDRQDRRQQRRQTYPKVGTFVLVAVVCLVVAAAAVASWSGSRSSGATTVGLLSATGSTVTGPTDSPDTGPVGLNVSSTGEASAGTKATTRVTISKSSGFHGVFLGTVESARPFKCADDRKVVVFKRQGPVQDPRTDKKVASDTAYAVGPDYRWQAQVTNWRDQNGGWFYARVGKTESCRADTSRTRRLFIAG